MIVMPIISCLTYKFIECAMQIYFHRGAFNTFKNLKMG